MAGRPKKYSDKDIEKMGKELLACMESPGVYYLTAYSEQKEKSPNWVYEIARDYPVFGVYLARARGILGRKILTKAIEANPSMYVQKTIMKRFLDNPYEPVIQWTKEDIEMEALAKAKAAKEANLTEIDPRVIEFLDLLKKKNK